MKKPEKFLYLLIFLFCLTGQLAHAEELEVNKDTAIKAIAVFKQDPLGEKARAAGSLVLNYANQSPDIAVTLSEKIVPWLTQEPKPPYGDELFIAYLVGNIQSQILRHKGVDNPHAGILTVLDVYNQIKNRDANFFIKSIEEMQQLQTKGKLREQLFSYLGIQQPESNRQRLSLVSRIKYPEKLDDYSFAGIHDYEKPELGISIRYIRNGTKNDYFDVYVYPTSNQQLEKLPKDAVTQEYGVARQGIYYGLQRGIYQSVDPVKETLYMPISNIYPTTQGIFELTRDNKALFSILYLTISNEYYLKLRATYPENKIKAQSGHLEKLFNQILNNVYIQ